MNPKEPCGSCGLTRDAHWGNHPIAAGRCTGFTKQSVTREQLAEALKACYLALMNETSVGVQSEIKRQAAQLLSKIDQEANHVNPAL